MTNAGVLRDEATIHHCHDFSIRFVDYLTQYQINSKDKRDAAIFLSNKF